MPRAGRIVSGAADGLAFSLPSSIGCVTLIFSHVGLELLPAGIFALLLGMAWMFGAFAGLVARAERWLGEQPTEQAGLVAERDEIIARIRKDSKWNVPEPELTLVINRHRKIIGYTIGNDMSSRSIEGENPLYLPQAKTYDDAAAIGEFDRIANQISQHLTNTVWRTVIKLAQLWIKFES